MEKISLNLLNLNRTASLLSGADLPKLAHTGFCWNDGDNVTEDWFPQGIAGIEALSFANKKFITVTWYSKDNDYEKGVRISFVDVTDMAKPLKYRHVLLIDSENKPLKGIHAGGLVFRNKNFHVPDSHNGSLILVFPLDELYELSTEERSTYFNYRYVLKQKSSYDAPAKPSFLSYDWSQDKFLTGTFDENLARFLYWYSLDSRCGIYCGPFFKKMQGSASYDNKLWIVCSYGRDKPSHLYYGEYRLGSSPKISNFSKTEFPPGLEDIHTSKTSENLWLLTEFPPSQGSYQGVPNERKVFAIRRNKINS